MKTRPYLIHALSPLHAGTGQAVDIIDLPIARMRSTGIPIVPGSSIKGVLRDARMTPQDQDRALATFGPETEQASDHAGALIVSDARLLAMPVRSFYGTFAWVTSPLLLTLASRDLEGSVELPKLPTLKAQHAVFSGKKSLNVPKGATLYLEDLDLNAQASNAVDEWAALFAKHVLPEHEEHFTQRFVIIDDETMTFLWETATQVDTRIRLNPDTRTVAKGALWIEESLPPETLLIGVLGAQSGSRREGVSMSADEVLSFALSKRDVLQFGGKATIGRGRCQMMPLGGAQ